MTGAVFYYTAAEGPLQQAATAGFVTGATWDGATPTDPTVTLPAAEAVLVRPSTGGELEPVAVLDTAFGHAWQSVMNEPGDGRIVLDRADPLVATIVDGDLVQYRVSGQAVHTIRVGDRDAVTVAEGEEHDETVTFAGPGHLALLDTATVYPSRGTGALPAEEDRAFNWASVVYDDSWWQTAASITTVEAAQAGGWSSVPFGDGFPAPAGASMIWAPGSTSSDAPEGDCYFRAEFFSAPGRVFLYVLIDNWGEVWFDGAKVMDIPPTAGFQAVTTLALEVSAGTHLVAVHGHNYPDDGSPGGNPGGIGVAVYQAGPNNQPLSGSPLLVTGPAWKMVPYPPRPPGMTPGEVIRVCIEEAQARGSLTGLTLGFTDEVDSGGMPWPEVTDIATKVGTDLLTFLRELTGTYVDLWMEPARFRLRAYVKDTAGGQPDVTLTAATDPTDPTSGNVVNVRHRRVGQMPANAFLVKWHGGWAEATDTPSIAAHGRHEAQLALGAAQSQQEALRVAVAQLGFYARAREQVSADIEPGGRRAETPWLAWRPGDSPFVPTSTGGSERQRCVSLSGAVDDDGTVTFAGEFGDRLLSPAERWEQAVKKMSDGTLRGTSQVATPASTISFDPGASKPDCCPPIPEEVIES